MTASRALSTPASSPPVTPVRVHPAEGRGALGGCLNDGNHNPTSNFDAVRLVYTPGVTVGPVPDRTVRDSATATRLAVEVAAWRQLYSSVCQPGPLGRWYTLSFAARGDLNGWYVFIPGQLCDTPAVPRVCIDMASLLGIPHNARRALLLSEASVHVVRSPGLLILPPIDRTIADPVAATRLADDIRRLRPQALGVPGGPSLVENCPNDYGTTYALTFWSPGMPRWTAVIHIMGCSAVTVPGWPPLFDFGDAKLLADLGTALGLRPDEVSPVPCGGMVRPGHICYQQPALATPH